MLHFMRGVTSGKSRLFYRSLLLAGVIIAAIPAQVRAQVDPGSHWGIGGSFIPHWTSHEKLQPLLFDGVGAFTGTEISFGIVRGSTHGGDWGVSFVQKPFEDGSGTVESNGDCSDPNFCFSFTQTRSTKGVLLRGVEIHWSKPFVTIRNRVQLGFNIAGGAARTKGNIEDTSVSISDVRLPNRAPIHEETTDRSTEPAADVFFYKVPPLFKLEAQGVFIVSPAFKIKVSGGVSFPGTSARVAAVYLIGAKKTLVSPKRLPSLRNGSLP